MKTLKLIPTLLVLLIMIVLPIKSRELEIGNTYNWDNYFNLLAKDEVEKYRNVMGCLESGNIDNICGGAGNHYRGRYQFGKDAANFVGVPFDSLFVKKWSDIALDRLMRANWELLRNYHKYVGKTINGIKITKAGMLAGAHLKGWTWVITYLESNGAIIGCDSNGTSIELYFKSFEHINLTKI